MSVSKETPQSPRFSNCQQCGHKYLPTFHLGEDRLIYCFCGWVMTSETSVFWKDGRDIPDGILQLGLRYVIEWHKWVRAGRPTLSEELTEQRRAICLEPCEHYKNDACKKCGCRMSKGNPLGDKPSWATAVCPVGKWPTAETHSHRSDTPT